MIGREFFMKFRSKKLSDESKNKIYYIFVAVVLLTGIIARVYQFGVVPGGLNQDEAFAGYDAFSIMTTGADSFGYVNPVYLVSWGSGMNVLNTYLMIPFVAMFGVCSIAVRMPQVIVACISLFVIYKLTTKMFSKSTGLIALMILALCPWHIMLSRWGLESNLAPGLILFGFYFFVLGIEKKPYFFLSAVCYGLSLYAYATIWPILPLIILCQFVYCVLCKKIKLFSVKTFVFAGILFVFALPLLLFMLVNTDVINEIKTSFISVPRLVAMRGSEISFNNMPEKIGNLFNILSKQSDGLLWNTIPEYGLFYAFGWVFAIIGGIAILYDVINKTVHKKFTYSVFLLINVVFPLFLGFVILVNLTRINSLFIPLIILSAVGVNAIIKCLCYLINKISGGYFELSRTILMSLVGVLYLVSFISFETTYFTSYINGINYYFNSGVEEAVPYAQEVAEGRTIYTSISYSTVLLYSQTNPQEYRNTVKYTNYPSEFLQVASCTNYAFNFQKEWLWDTDKVFVIKNSECDVYGLKATRNVKTFDTISVIY